MPDHPPPQPTTEPVHPDVRIETRDADVFGLVMFFIGFVFLAVVAHVLLYAFFVGLRRDREAEAKAAAPPPTALQRPKLPEDIPEPRLQVGDAADMKALLARDQKLLDGEPAWADAKRTAVRIPIADALAILSDPREAAKHGLKLAPPKDAK
jgi:hypothetical protein